MSNFRWVAVVVMFIGTACLAYVLGSLLRFLDPMGDWEGRAVALIAGSTSVVALGAILWLLTELVACVRQKRE